MRIFTFVLFLIAYGLWLWGSGKLFQQISGSGRGFVWVTQGMIVLSYGGFFAFIYLLSGLWSTALVVLFFVASQLGVVLAWILNLAFGSSSEASTSRIFAAGAEFGLRYPLLTRVLQGFCVVVMFAYVIVAGVIHFRYPWNSYPLHVGAVKYTLIFLIFGSYPMFLAGMVAMLSAENIDESTRQQILVNQLGGMIPNALFVALALWAFGAGGNDVPASLGLVLHTYSPRVIGLIVAFFVLLFVLPYWIGNQRGNRRRRKLLEKRRDFTAELARVLEAPTPTKYTSNLDGLRGKVASEWRSVMNSSPVMDLCTKYEKDASQVDMQLQVIAAEISKSKQLDPRFPYVEGLSELDSQIKDISDFLQGRPPGTIVEDARGVSETLEKQKSEIDQLINPKHTAKPVMAGLVATIVSAVVATVASGIGQAAWGAISHGGMHK